jgi:hydroxyethylthiazole kinase-like uncharacterized protein yjeF
MKLVTAAQMREIDRQTIEDYGLPGIVLMENAGRAVVAAVERLLSEVGGGPVVVVAGRGNNGGDGFVVARWLHAAGRPVEVCLLAAADELSGDAAANCALAAGMGVTIHERVDPALLAHRLAQAALIVDAVLGTGISGEVTGSARAAVEAINAAPAPVVAVDIPSGVDADSGAVLGDAVSARLTVTFGLAKVGLHLYPGRGRCGEIRVAPIGIPPALADAEHINTNLTTEADAAAMLPARAAAMHKGDAGRLLIVAGSVGMTGAAAMAGLGAMRAGAGLVYLAVPESLNDILEARCTEVLTLPMPETDARSLATGAAEPLLEFAQGVDAVLMGPGLSQHPETAELVRRLAAELHVPLALDADGLNAFAGRSGELAGRPAATVLTPHPGEMARLTGQSIAQIQADRPAAARSLAAELDLTVVLKGAATVTADPHGQAWINPTGSQALASGGTGDVLAGMVGAFLAGGAEPLAAGAAAAYYHGKAADAVMAASRRGLLASDLLAALPAVFPPP